jgi:hypothetical protein
MSDMAAKLHVAATLLSGLLIATEYDVDDPVCYGRRQTYIDEALLLASMLVATWEKDVAERWQP